MTPERLEKAAGELALARRKLEKEIRWARRAGLPLRVIAKSAHISHEQVRRLTS